MPELISFADKMKWDSESKTAISVRDGVLEYLGSEINQTPADKVFKVYRSPATIANVASKMAGLQLTNDHISLDVIDITDACGKVDNAEMIDFINSNYDSKLAIKNSINVDDDATSLLTTGKRELSLGYKANLVPHEVYDFEQRNIEPHHLALVNAGRCGSECSFIDKDFIKENKNKEGNNMSNLHVAFKDEDGQPNLQQIVEIAQALPEALKNVPMDKLQEIMPMLQEVVSMAKPETPTEPAMEDEQPEEAPEVEDEEKEKPMEVKDTAEFKDAVTSAIEKHTAVIEKAKNFVDEAYVYKGKTTEQIMRDALAVEHGSERFSDSELNVAFKLLKKVNNKYANFGDASHEGKFLSLANKKEG